MPERNMVKQLWLVPLLGALAFFTAPIAWADTYTDTVVGQLSPTTHVVVDSNASPKLPNPDPLNDQIKQSGVPIWVLNVAKDQTGNITPESVKDALYDAHNPITNPIQVGNDPNHKPPLIIEVIDGKGYHAQAYDVSQAVADAIEPDILHAAKNHHGDLNGAVSEFVSTLATVPNSGPPVAASPAPVVEHHDYTGWWVFLWVIVSFLVVGFLSWIGYIIATGRREKNRVKNQINNHINTVEAAVSDLADDVLQGVDVGNYHTKASLALATAKEARDKRDWYEAESQISIADDYVSKAYGKAKPDKTAIAATPKKERRLATINAVDASGNPVTVKNNEYRRHRESNYRHYYAGGQTQGVYFYPGWYPYPFWTYSWNPGDVVVNNNADLLDQWSGRYTSDHQAYSSPLSSSPFDYTRPSDYSGSSSGSGSAGFSGGGYSGSHHSSSSSSGSSSGYSGSSSSSSSSSGFSDFGGGGGGSFGGDSSGGGSAGF